MVFIPSGTFMMGNVLERCFNPWHNNFQNAPFDYRVLDNNDNRYQNILANAKILIEDKITAVLRGGSWFHTPWDCRSAYRAHHADVSDCVGFRVVCPPVDCLLSCPLP